MKIFDKRPLSLILCILLGAFVFFAFGDKWIRILIISISALLIILPLFIRELSKKLQLKIVVCASLAILASLISYLYFDLWYYADKRFSERCEIEGTVESFDFTDSSKTISLSTKTINEKSLSNYRIIVNITSQNVTNITVGTEISFSAELNDFKASEDFDAASYYYSRGYSATAENVENLQIISQGNIPISNKITEYRNSLSRRLVLYSSEKSGGLLAALLLGDRTFLSGQIKLDFSRIGISHILALSGMHLAILCYGFSRILLLLGVNKKCRKLSEIIFALFYMALTGFPVSVMRAGIMLILSSLLFLLCGSKDSITNLFIAVAFIILIQPYSAFDISLWLSAFATLGIVIFSELNEKKPSDRETKEKGFDPISFFAPLLSSVFAIGATILISHISFNSISSLSLFSTLVFSVLINLFMYLGTFFLLTASFIPLGKTVNFCGDIITDFAHTLSSFKYSLLSTEFWLTKILIIVFSVFLFFFLVLEFKRKKTATLIVTLLLFSSVFIAGIYTSNQMSAFDFEYNEQEENEKILIKKYSDTVLLEISTPSNNVSYQSLSYLKEHDIVYLEKYIITSYSTYTPRAIEIILSSIYVEDLYIPKPKSEYHEEIYSEILELEDLYKVNFITYSEEEIIKFSDFAFVPIYYDEDGRFAATINYENEFYTYVSAHMLDSRAFPHALKIMNGANTVIIGSKGAKSNSEDFIYKLGGTTKLIYNKKSGLTDETLKYYENRITVDPNGTVELYVE